MNYGAIQGNIAKLCTTHCNNTTPLHKYTHKGDYLLLLFAYYHPIIYLKKYFIIINLLH